MLKKVPAHIIPPAGVQKDMLKMSTSWWKPDQQDPSPAKWRQNERKHKHGMDGRKQSLHVYGVWH
jgi:hypothetical protein